MQLRELFTQMPSNVPVFNTNESSTQYFTNYLTQNIAKYMLPGDEPQPRMMDLSFSTACQFL